MENGTERYISSKRLLSRKHQFQGSIEAIQHRVSQINPELTRQEITRIQSSIDRAIPSWSSLIAKSMRLRCSSSLRLRSMGSDARPGSRQPGCIREGTLWMVRRSDQPCARACSPAHIGGNKPSSRVEVLLTQCVVDVHHYAVLRRSNVHLGDRPIVACKARLKGWDLR
jgi:hypothetical protein